MKPIARLFLFASLLFPSYPASWNSVREAWMQRTVHVPAGWGNDRVILHFEAVAGKAQVFVDRKKVAENFDLFLPFEADVTDLVTPGADFDLRVFVQSQKLFEDRSGVGRRTVPAGSMWGSFIDGIWQDVYLLRRGRSGLLRPLRRWHLPAGYPDKTCQINRL